MKVYFFEYLLSRRYMKPSHWLTSKKLQFEPFDATLNLRKEGLCSQREYKGHRELFSRTDV